MLVRPAVERQAIDLLLDLVGTGELTALLVDSLTDLMSNTRVARYLQSAMGKLNTLLRDTGCAFIAIDDVNSLWKRWLR